MSLLEGENFLVFFATAKVAVKRWQIRHELGIALSR